MIGQRMYYNGKSSFDRIFTQCIYTCLAACALMAIAPCVMAQNQVPNNPTASATLKEKLKRRVVLIPTEKEQSISDGLSSLCDQAQVRILEIPEALRARRALPYDLVTYLPLRAALDQILDDTGYTWKIEKGSIRVVPSGVPTVLEFLNSHKETPVAQLPPGRLRREWEAIKRVHPNARRARWAVMQGWGPVPAGLEDALDQRRHSFMRICPDNGAFAIDWASVHIQSFNGVESVDYLAGNGPSEIPAEFRRQPKMEADEAWKRVEQALQILHRPLPAKDSHSSRSILRIVQDKSWGEPMRLVWQFSATKSPSSVCVDVSTGEVGGVREASFGDGGPNPADWLYAFIGRSDRWIATSPLQETPQQKPGVGTVRRALNTPITLLNDSSLSLYDAVTRMFEQSGLRTSQIPEGTKRVKVDPILYKHPLQFALDPVFDDTGYTYKIGRETIRIVPTGIPTVAEFLKAHKEAPVNLLPPGRLRREWEIVKGLHPNAARGDWVLKQDLESPKLGGITPWGDLFVRRCPGNRAITLDWANVYLVARNGSEIVDYRGGAGLPEILPELRRRPSMDATEAWRRLEEALMRLHAQLPAESSHPESSVLRIVEDNTRARTMRLVWQFAVAQSKLRVCVDTATGEVGGVKPAVDDDTKADLSDPLYVLWSMPERWISTTPRPSPSARAPNRRLKP